jgi:hypothetical protein
MKHARRIGVIAVLLLIMATPSQAMAQSWWEGFANAPQANGFWQWLLQYPGLAGPLYQDPYQIYDPRWRAQNPQLLQYINNNPGWWNGVLSLAPQYYSDPFNEFLRGHPRIAADLSQNPGLIYDPRYLAANPALRQFLATHRKIWRSIQYRNYAYSNTGGWGAYNDTGQWHNQNWWRDNGDWDDRNQWHDRDWWEKNNRDLAERRHPEWFARQLERRPEKEPRRPGNRGHGEAGHGRD